MINPGLLRLSVIGTLVSLPLAGCGGTESNQKKTVSSPQQEQQVTTSKSFTMKGTVREINAAEKEVTIAHDAMPGFMGAMTMPFNVPKAELLEDVQPGDEVEGKIDVVFERNRVKSYQLKTLEVTNPAPVTMKLNLGPSGATLSTKKPVLKPGEVVPDFVMTTQDGKAIKLSDLRGKVVVLTFIYTRCPLPDFCPASDAAFGELAKVLGEVRERADQVRLLSLSFDPEHDTPEVLRAHAQRRGAKPPLWSFAVARHDELEKVAEPLGLSYGPMKNEIIHNLSTAVIGPDGKLVQLYLGKAGTAWTVGEVSQRVVERLRLSKK
jgi:protein SCO1/2